MNESSPPDLAAIEKKALAALAKQPNNAEALRLLASVLATGSAPQEAERLLRKAIALAPNFIIAYADLASLLCRLERADDAITLLDDAAATQPDEIWPLSIKAAVFSAERRAEDALAAHRAVVARAPHATVPWTNYAHALKAVGALEEAVTAYRKAIELDPANGSSWWGLANLRTVRFEAKDVAAMQKALAGNARDPLQQVHLHFGLGKGLGDLGHYEPSFRHYEEANRLRGRLVPYDAGSTTALVDGFVSLLTPELLSRRQTLECGKDAIFILGMPRSGSTLVEQILASHPMVEGAGELFDLRNVADHITPSGVAKATLPAALTGLSADDLKAIGERYLHVSRRHRKTDRPFFTDKMPSNWQLTPLIHLALPNAKIIDVRRDPLACCFSSFTTYFNLETSFPANLKDLGRYYRDYTRLMAHMDAALPGRIYRIRHEQVVEDLEGEVRRLLDFLELPFHPACLRFHETERAIYTPSAQQVRSPINRDGLDRWRNYEMWLKPLTEIGSP